MTNFAWVRNIYWFREDVINNLIEAELILMDGHPKSACNALKACVENILTDFCNKRGIRKIPNYSLYNTLQIAALRRELKDEKLIAGLEEIRICGNKGSHSMEDVDFVRADRCFETVATLIYRLVTIVGDPRLPRWNFRHYSVDRREKTVEVVKIVEDTAKVNRLTKAIEDEKRKTAKATKIAADSRLEVVSAKEREVMAVARANKAEADKTEAENNAVFAGIANQILMSRFKRH